LIHITKNIIDTYAYVSESIIFYRLPLKYDKDIIKEKCIR